MVVAMTGEPSSLVARMNFTQIQLPGNTNLEELVNGSMTENDGGGNANPLFALAVPSDENGLWTLTPSGGMTTTWKLRDGIRWHDGTSLTAEDFVFAFKVDSDKDIPSRKPIWYPYITSASAPDASTVTLAWDRVYILADRSFSAGGLTPLPRHILSDAFQPGDKTAFLGLPYWAEAYVGSGPFKLRDYTRGSSIVLVANDDYVLGRPRIDRVDVRFFPDINVLVTNLLSGSVDMTAGRGLAVEQASLLGKQWAAGHVDSVQSLWVTIYPQFLNPRNPIVTALPFRQALMYGTDRPQLMDAMVGGLSDVGTIWMDPTQKEFKEVDRAAVHYQYDPRRAAQLIEGLGYSKGPDGTYRSATGERLAVHMRSNGEPITQSTVIPVADMWKRLGVDTEPEVIVPERLSDREYLANFPDFRMMRQSTAVTAVQMFHSSAMPRAENSYVGQNYARYSNPELDALIDRALSTISYGERVKTYQSAAALTTQNLNMLPMFYDLAFIAVNNRIKNVGGDETRYWNIHQWEIPG